MRRDADRLALKAGEVGERIGLSESRVYELIAAGVIPSFRLLDGRGRIRVSLPALEDWMARSTAEETARRREKADDRRKG